MNPSIRPDRVAPLRRGTLAGLALLTSAAWAQTAAPSSTDAATLAKYDLNRNGTLDPAERSALEADQRKAAGAVAAKPADSSASSTSGGSEEIVALSPFEVVSETKGYYSANTMSGTRFNSKLEDLGASISVMTKEQMQDFAMLDINDVFLYTANAEGTGTYTAQTVNRNGDVQEDVSMNPTQANRVRGIAPANISIGNVETMGRTPVDPLGIDGIEISRGPNASVFGLGNPSGTVNMVPAGANLTRDRSQLQLRVDNWGGYRTSLDMNRVIKKGVLSVRASGSFQHDAFQLKPSGVNSVRYNGYVRYQPFKTTTISGSYSVYRMNGNRPNASPLRDNVSYWISQGRPTWDPVLQVIHVNGQTIGAAGVGSTAPITADTGVPDYFNRSFTGSGRTYVYVGNTGVEHITTPTSTLTATPITGSGTIRLMSLSAGAGVAAGRFSNQPLFTTTPVVQDRAIYDYTKINLTAINRVRDKNLVGSVVLDQVFLNSQRHTLALQAGFTREESKRYQRNTLGELNQNGQSSQLLIDINEKRIDGTPNPFFLRPYIGIDQPYVIEQPQRWDTSRAQLGYRLDFSKEKNALHWLGQHMFSGYQEFKYRVSRRYSYQDRLRLDNAQLAGNTGLPYFRYYIGDNVGNNVDYSPTSMANGQYNLLFGNPTTGYVTRLADLPLAASTGRAGGGNNTQTKLRTRGGVVQSHFLESRIVTTFGQREDKQFIKNGSTPVALNADGLTFNYDGQIDHWALGDYRFNSGKTKQKGAVVRPFRGWKWTNSLVSNPGLGGALGQFLNGLSFSYNQSDSFRPEEPRFSVYEEALPNPYGTGKDWAIAMNLFENKFVLKINKYENAQVATRNGDAGTIAQRVTRLDFSQADPFQLANQATAWVTAANPTWTQAQIETEVGRQMGIPWERQQRVEALFNSGRLSSPNDVVSKGVEIELNFNPTNYWTVAANASDTRSMNQNVSKEIGQWIAERMPHWTTIRDPRIGVSLAPSAGNAAGLWWNQNYGGSQTAAQNYAVFVGGPFSVVQQSEGTANPQIRRYKFGANTNFRLSGITQHKILSKMNVGGSLRWQDKGAIGYYGQNYAALLAANQPITALDKTNPIYDKAQTFIDAFVGYRVRLYGNKVNANFQLNVRNLTESGKRLQPIGAYPDGRAHSFRIVDPRIFILQATFDL